MIDYKAASFVFNSSLFIALVSAVIFCVLIILRFFRDKEDIKRRKQRNELKKKVFLYLNNPTSDLKNSLTESHYDVSILAEIANDLLRNLKGKSYLTLLELMSEAGIYDYIRRNLFSDDRAKYTSVINISSHLAGAEIKQRLIDLLEDDNYLVRYTVAEALAYTHDSNLLPIIIKKFSKEEDLSYMMIANIFDIFGDKVVDIMSDLLNKRQASSRLKMAALMILAKHFNTKEIHQASESLYRSKDHALRAMLFYALAEARVEADIKILTKGKKDKDWQVRQNVARCSRYSFPESAQILTDLLKDKNWLVGLQAAKSLAVVGKPGQRILSLIAENNSMEGSRAKMIMAENNLSL